MRIEKRKRSKKKLTKQKITKAVDSFWKNFDEYDLGKANKELQDITNMFHPHDRTKIIFEIRKGLEPKKIQLDFLK